MKRAATALAAGGGSESICGRAAQRERRFRGVAAARVAFAPGTVKRSLLDNLGRGASSPRFALPPPRGVWSPFPFRSGAPGRLLASRAPRSPASGDGNGLVGPQRGVDGRADDKLNGMAGPVVAVVSAWRRHGP